MSLKSLTETLKNWGAETSETSAKKMTFQCKAPIHAGCTPETSETSENTNSREIYPASPTGEAANDPAAPEMDSQPSAELPELVKHPAPASAADKPARPRKLKYMEWADTWRELDQAYQRHHGQCPVCKAAGLGYGLRCGAGAALWTPYDKASERKPS